MAAKKKRAPRKTAKRKPRGRGRPPKHEQATTPEGTPEFKMVIDAAAVMRMAEGGMTDHEIARALGINRTTLWRWTSGMPDLCNALKLGKELPDNRVQRSLYHRAVGYSFEAEKIMNVDGRVVRVPYTEHHPPDTTAAIFWLKNRCKDEWRDRYEATDPDQNQLLVRLIDLTGKRTKGT